MRDSYLESPTNKQEKEEYPLAKILNKQFTEGEI